jgi:alkylhydroperoxidase family enzyme
MYGLTDDEIAAVLDGTTEGFAPAEQALLRLADTLAGAPVTVSDALYAELRRHFSEEQLIELAADAAQENFRARWNRVFDVGSDGLYCVLPQQPAAPERAIPEQLRRAG